MSKEVQLEIINKYNPMHDNYHTGIRSINDIKTYKEALKIAAEDGYELNDNDTFSPDYGSAIIKNAIKTGKITVYSSYPIEQGTFVTPSKMEAQSYAGNGKIYSKTVALEDVAWIDGVEGQYANAREYAKNLYDGIVYDFALKIMERYSIVPERNDDFEYTLSDFDMVKEREDGCEALGIKPYMFIADNIRNEYIEDFLRKNNIQPYYAELVIDHLAETVYDMCRHDIAEAERFENEVNRIVTKYFQKYQSQALFEMYEKNDLYDEVGRDKFIDVRAKKWDAILRSETDRIAYDVVLSGLYDEDSPSNEKMTKTVLIPEIARILATFERDDLEGGLKKTELKIKAIQNEER